MDKEAKRNLIFRVLLLVLVIIGYWHLDTTIQENYNNLTVQIAEAKSDFQKGWGENNKQIAEVESDVMMGNANTMNLWMRSLNSSGEESLSDWKSSHTNFSKCDPGYNNYRIQHSYMNLNETGRAKYLIYNYDKGDLVFNNEGQVTCFNNNNSEVSCVELCE